MATTVITAFNEFMKDYVNLPSTEVTKARASRNWLVDQINNFPSNHIDFPELYTEKHFGFGSFARSTKKRPLDDIDHLLCMKAQGVTYSEFLGTIYMEVPDGAYPFTHMKQTDSNYLSSIKVVNRFVKYLNEVPQYEKADIKRNQEAATLQLTTYPWNFDIVPCFHTAPEVDGRSYYLIPDGKGNWRKTDPTLDKSRVSRVNQTRDGNVLNVIRIMKYWNRRPTMASMSSYLVENMILDFYENNECSQWVDWEVRKILLHIKDRIYLPVYDPKGIQGNINNLSDVQKFSIFSRAYDDEIRAAEAKKYETENPAYAISKWQQIFGSNFPNYTG